MNDELPRDAWTLIASILRKGHTVELKKINGQLHIIEIRRKIKDRVTLVNGQADG